MTDEFLPSRRTVLRTAGVGVLGALGGCSQVQGNSGTPTPPANPPNPTILNARAEIENFRQTQSKSMTYVLVKNEGGLGEIKVTVQLTGKAAIYNEGSKVFSLKPGQEHQLGFELFSHEGAEEVEIHAKSTAVPDNEDSFTITEEGTPDAIDYQ